VTAVQEPARQDAVTCEQHDREGCAECARAARRIYIPDVVVSGNGINAPWDYGPGTGGQANIIGMR
jgi:hypothetical protein